MLYLSTWDLSTTVIFRPLWKFCFLLFAQATIISAKHANVAHQGGSNFDLSRRPHTWTHNSACLCWATNLKFTNTSQYGDTKWLLVSLLHLVINLVALCLTIVAKCDYMITLHVMNTLFNSTNIQERGKPGETAEGLVEANWQWYSSAFTVYMHSLLCCDLLR